MSDFRSGFCVVTGRPNVGKSTLVNRLVGARVSIVSTRPQTTRHRISGVVHGEGFQIVLVDTPGIHRPRHQLGQHMVSVATAALAGADVVAIVVDVSSRPGPADREVVRLCRQARAQTVVIANKADRVAGSDLTTAADRYREFGFPIITCSALTGDGVDRVQDAIRELLPPGPPYFPPDMYTDQPEQVVVSELIREQVLALTRDEVPHAVAVTIDEFALRPDGMVYVRATIHVERDSQKGIIIGSGGGLLREIGRKARLEAEALLGSRMYLDLWVKVARDWRRRADALRRMGFVRGRD